MPPEGQRVLLARSMNGWTLDYVDRMELRERLETLVVLSARAAAEREMMKDA